MPVNVTDLSEMVELYQKQEADFAEKAKEAKNDIARNYYRGRAEGARYALDDFKRLSRKYHQQTA